MQEPLGDHLLQEVLASAGAVCLQHHLPTMDRVSVYFAYVTGYIRICQGMCKAASVPCVMMLQAVSVVIALACCTTLLSLSVMSQADPSCADSAAALHMQLMMHFMVQ